MSNFYLSKASVLYDSITDGTHDSPKTVSIGKKLITSKHIKGGEIDFATANLISTEDFEFINKRSKVDKWDVIISMIGEYCGFCYIERNDVIDYAVKNVGLFKTGVELEAKWLYYYLNSQAGKQYLKQIRLGSSQPYLSLGGLRSLPILNCDAHLKKSIVKILSSLDSKIELNNRINTELEAMAKTIYDYWFVQFDFPTPSPSGRAGVGLPYKTSGGKMVWNEVLKREIPEGWEVNCIGDLLSTNLGGTPATKVEAYWNGDINWLNSGEIANFPIISSELKITKEAIKKSAAELMPRGTVLISITRHLRLTVLAIDACANQSVVGIKEKGEIKYYFIYPYLKNEIPRLMTLRTGAQQPHINKEIVDDSIIVVPKSDSGILQRYNTTVGCLYESIMNNALENQQLTNLRDWLLPMLMNGQVTVGKAYEQVEEVLGMVAEEGGDGYKKK